MPYFPLLFILKGEFLCGNNFPYKVKLKYQKERKLNMAAFLNFTKEKEKELKDVMYQGRKSCSTDPYI